MKNQSVKERQWIEEIDDYEVHFQELIRQPYRNMVISAGKVQGHPVDTIYLLMERDGDRPIEIIMRPDEAAAICWCLTGTLWSAIEENNETD